ncbi:MAG: Mut7-C RNAse domain [Nitrospira sp.]|jgi:uncharacterized protein with PIN domain|nr:Mut7-C RNAse domain [Nitrospira sp.]
MSPQENEPIVRFMADAMLGRLARLLSILSYDTAYEEVISDKALIDQSLGENPWVPTRDGLRNGKCFMDAAYVAQHALYRSSL